MNDSPIFASSVPLILLIWLCMNRWGEYHTPIHNIFDERTTYVYRNVLHGVYSSDRYFFVVLWFFFAARKCTSWIILIVSALKLVALVNNSNICMCQSSLGRPVFSYNFEGCGAVILVVLSFWMYFQLIYWDFMCVISLRSQLKRSVWRSMTSLFIPFLDHKTVVAVIWLVFNPFVFLVSLLWIFLSRHTFLGNRLRVSPRFWTCLTTVRPMFLEFFGHLCSWYGIYANEAFT